VFLDADDQARLAEQRWGDRPEFQSGSITRRLGWFGPTVLTQRDDGSCLFLMDDGRCRIHAEFGEPAKPWACRMFPFELVPWDDRALVSTRFNCPSVARSLGRPIKEHLGAIRELADKALPPGRYGPPALRPGAPASWPVAKGAVETLEEIVIDSNLPLIRRLVIGLEWCQLVELTPEFHRPTEKTVPAFRVLRESAESSASRWFGPERLAPTAIERLLFRQAAAEYGRYHPNLGDRPGWGERWRLLRAAWSIARGRGRLPRIHPSLPDAGFDDLELPLGSLPADTLAPLVRFFETAVAGVRYCGAARRGWSILEGFRGLALAYPIGLWLLRWVSAGRTPTPEDAVLVAGILDRSHETPFATGWRHRRRVSLLAGTGGLAKLVAWYGR
jgi:lysine-N-methylase